MKAPLLFLPALVLVLFAAGCGKSPESPGANGAAKSSDLPNMEADLARTLKEQGDFYVFKGPADMPADLKWENGSDLPEFADVNAKKGGTFTFWIPDFPRTLRTIGPDATGGIRTHLLDFTELGIVHAHPNVPNGVFPGLTTEWAAEPQTKTVYFRLDPKARWSDGKPVTTDDVVYHFYMMRSPHLNEPWYNDFYTKTYQRVTIFDKLTFAVTLQELKPDLVLRAGNWVPYPRHAFQDFGPGWTERHQWKEIPKTGAYQLFDKDIDKGRAVTLTRLKDWWAIDKRFFRGRFNPDRYRLEVIRDPDKAVESFARGDIDMVPLNLPKYWYEVMPQTHPEVAAGRVVRFRFFNQIPRPDWGLWINRAKPHLNNLDVRLGIQYASNFDLVCSQFFRGDSERQQTRSDGHGWRTHPTIKPRPFDPVKAREHFAKAGFTQQGPDGVLIHSSGQRLSFTITAYGQAFRDMLPILKQEALKAGLEFNLEILDQTTGYKKMQEKNHDIAVAALSRSVEPYPRYWESNHGSNAYEDAYTKDGQPSQLATGAVPNPNPQKLKVQTNNMTSLFIPKLDLLIEQYDRASTMEEIKRLAGQIEEIIHEDAAWVNGWKNPAYRGAYWRYVKWPKEFNVAQSRDPEEFMVHWVDTEMRNEIENARRTGKTYPSELLIFDRYKEN
jgi:microcin C transport system substrate-binding protein